MHVSSESERGDPVGNWLENELAGHGLDIRPRTGHGCFLEGTMRSLSMARH